MKKLLLPLGTLFFLVACNDQGPTASLVSFKPIDVKYPETKKDTTVIDNYFGTPVADPYRWLENDTSVETAAWVKAQNEVTNGYLNHIPFRDAIRKRYTELFNYEKFYSPFKEGGYNYYYLNSGLQNHAVLYRENAEGKDREVFLDPNTFSADGTTSLSGISFSKDGSLAAYNISQGGSDWQKLVVMNAKTKQQTGDTLELKFSGASWKGNEGFYYSTYPKPVGGSLLSGMTSNHKLYFHKLGTPQSEDVMVFGSDTNPTRYISGGVSEDQRWLFIYTANETYGNGLLAMDLTKPGSAAITIVGDMKNSHGVIDNDDQYFYIQTDKDAPTSRIVAAPIANPGPENWKTIIEAKPEVLTASSGGGYIFCTYLKDAISKVTQHDMTGKLVREVEIPGIGSVVGGFSAKKLEKELYFGFTSYTTPLTIYKYDIASGKSTLYKKSALKFNPDDYESKQVFYNSKDGTKIPMIITYKKGTKMDGKNPCMLYGYGGFSVSLTPYFSTSSMILLENGGIYAVPNLRGGGEYGEDWHNAGIKTKKQNVFDDFIAAAKYLVDSNYTSRELLAIAGGSNGGLLVGACMTQQPGMCKVAFPAVGVMDMLRYHKFTAGAGWAYDYGTSEDNKEMFDYLYGYSPVQSLKPASYPATLVTTADHDDRVVPAHSFKFAATLQENHNGANPVLIRIETKAGHGAGKSTQQVIEEETDKWSFMFYNIGLQPKYE